MNSNNPSGSRVVVVTRTKDRPVLLRRAIESVLGQSFRDWRHVLVNDGGNAGVVDLLAAEFAEAYRGRLQVIHNPRPIGMQNASNTAIQATESEYVAIHDDDDAWMPEFLEKCVAHLDRLGVDHPVQGVVTHTAWIFEELDTHGNIVELWRQAYPAKVTISLMDMAGENRYPPIAFLYRRQAHARVGYFNEEFSVLGDWDFNLRFLAHYDLAVIPEQLAQWHWRRQGGESAYGNSVTAGRSVHQEMETRLLNHYFRRDLQDGRPGLGYLLNVSRQIAQLAQRVDELKVRAEQGAGTAAATLAHAEHLNRVTRDLARLWNAKDWLRRGLAIMRERRGPASTPAVDPGRALRAEMAQSVSSLRPGDVLSLDVFDTALLRVLRQPTDLFAFIEPEVQKCVQNPQLAFARMRVTAERVARRRHVKADCEDVTLRQIYDVLVELSGLAPAVAASVSEIEIAAERWLCYVNPIVLEAARNAKRKGIRVVFVSDMYLPEVVVRDLLESKGYEACEVFVSAAVGKTKHSGALFEQVLKKLGCAAERVLHVGDHAESDHLRPRSLGIRTLHLNRKDYAPTPLADQHAALSGTGGAEVLASVFTGLARRRAVVAGTSDDVWDRLGYELAGPLIYAFVRWIAQQASAQGVGRLFFLSRDGYLPEKVFRACAVRWGLDIESVYMYSSRRMLNLARIDCLNEAALDFLMTADPFLRGRDFLERIGLSAGVYASDAAKAGLADLDAELTTRAGCFRTPEIRECIRRLLVGLEPQILEIAAAERRKLLAYFEDLGFAPGPIAIVDLGWQASSIRSLQDLLRRQQPDYRLRGYYFGTWHAAAPVIECGCRLESFFFHLGRPEQRAGLLAECVELVEHLFAAPHPTVVSLERAQNGWRPICGAWETTPAQRECLEKVASAAMAFVEDMLPYEPMAGTHAPPFGYLESVLERVLHHPTRAEAETLGALPHRDSFGAVAPWRYLAKVPSTAIAVFKPGSAREAYERSYWKKAFLAQLGPTERAMVTG